MGSLGKSCCYLQSLTKSSFPYWFDCDVQVFEVFLVSYQKVLLRSKVDLCYVCAY